MIKFFVGTICILFSSMFVFANQERQTDDKIPKPNLSTEEFMKVKLKHSTNIVEGLAMENFAKIAGSAEALLQLSQEADWNTLKTDTYLKMSNEFRSSVRRLHQAGKDKNLDASTLAYFEVTLNCVRCHKYVRGNK